MDALPATPALCARLELLMFKRNISCLNANALRRPSPSSFSANKPFPPSSLSLSLLPSLSHSSPPLSFSRSLYRSFLVLANATSLATHRQSRGRVGYRSVEGKERARARREHEGTRERARLAERARARRTDRERERERGRGRERKPVLKRHQPVRQARCNKSRRASAHANQAIRSSCTPQ